jgi:hypothetical protein
LDNQISQKFSRRYSTAFDKALEDPQKNYDILLNRYYKDLEKHVKMAGGLPVGPQSKLVGEVIQGELKFPRPIVMSRTRNQGRNPRQREAMTMEAGLPRRNLEPRKIIPSKPQPFGTPMQPASTAKPMKAKTQTFVRKALAQNLINAHVPNAETMEREMLLSQGEKVPHNKFKDILSSHNRFKAEVEAAFKTPSLAKFGGATVVAANRAFRRRDRADTKCGNSYIAKGKKCRKGQGLSPRGRKIAAAAGVGLTAGLVAAALYRKRPGGGIPTSGVGTAPPGNPGTPSLSGAPAGAKLAGLAAQRRLTGLTPKGLLPPSPPRKSKTQRMRENTSASIKLAEQRIGQTAKEEVRRLAQIGNTMAAAGEASGNVVKTTMRELRLRAEAARRKYEPGYRKAKPKQLTSGALRLPMRAKVEQRAKLKRMDSLTPSTVRNDRLFGNNKKLKCGPGSKPCGNACIPKNHKCRASWNKPVKLAAGVLGVGAVGIGATALFHKDPKMRAAAAGVVEPVSQIAFGVGNAARGNYTGTLSNLGKAAIAGQNLGPNLRTLGEGYKRGAGNMWNQARGKAKEAGFKAKHHRPAK